MNNLGVILTHCAMRLGDQLAALHFLRALAKAYPDIHFRHSAPLCYLQQMIEVVCDLPNVQLRDIAHSHNEHSWNLWKNAGAFWENHALKNEYAPFMLEFFAVAAKRMGLESPLKTPTDLLFDYPALDGKHLTADDFDVLIVNSPPMSGQWRKYDVVAMNTLVQSLGQRHRCISTHPSGTSVPCTQNVPGFSITNIGQLSQKCRYIVMVSTGPSWPSFNAWNRDKIERRLILIDSEKVELAPNTEHCATVAEASRVLKFWGLL
jgi:hypothetical protein